MSSAMTSAVEERTSTARYVMSPRLPMGVLTRYSVPVAPVVTAFAELTKPPAIDSALYAAYCLNFSASASFPTNPIT